MSQGELIDVALAIADGAPIDWAAVAAPSTPLPADLSISARIVERIARVHASLPPVGASSSSLHASLAGVPLPEDDAAEALAPVTWGALAIVAKIGRGTFGDVYLAHDPRLTRPVALKLLRRKDRLESVAIEEGQMMARVAHPNVVTVYGAERIDARVGIWMQFVDGPTLEQQLQREGPFPALRVMEAGTQLASGLAAVHRAGLLHRDVKAQNAMRDADGRVLLTDFGTGRPRSEPTVTDLQVELAGTPVYMAPELLNGSPASVSSDIYSLGVVLFHLATDSFPVQGRSLRDLREAHREGRRTSLAEARSGLPKRLVAAIDRATHPDPLCRHASATELEADLAAALPSSRRPGSWVAAAALVLSAGLVSGTILWRHEKAEVDPAMFRVRDALLVARFDNTTGEGMFDGGLEYAIGGELGRSAIIDIVPAERVIDTLRHMKRPVETVVDRTIGREISLRDGRIKAMVTGRIEHRHDSFVLTTELVDPADGSVVVSTTAHAKTAAAMLQAAGSGAQGLERLFSQHRARIKGASPVQHLSTSSLEAFRLHNESVQAYWRRGHPEDAEPINRRALAADPECAVAWVFRAYLLRNMIGPGAESREAEAAEAAQRALALAESAPDWERHFLRGVYHVLAGDHVRAIPDLAIALRLRPDSEPASLFLKSTSLALGKFDTAVEIDKGIAAQRPFDLASNFAAASGILHLRGSLEEAQPYIDRIDELLTPQRTGAAHFYGIAQWRRLLPAYIAWKDGNLDTTRLIVEREEALLPRWPAERGSMAARIGYWYLTLGRLRDAERLLASSGVVHDLIAVAELRDDVQALRRYLSEPPPNVQVERLVRAGLLEQAQERLRARVPDLQEEQIENIGRAALWIATGQSEPAILLLRRVLAPGPPLYPPYHKGCELLATALVRTNRRAEAVAELERCTTVMPRFWGNFNAGYWMKNLVMLAEEYRAAGRLAEAGQVESRLQRLLIYADDDHPIVIRLGRDQRK